MKMKIGFKYLLFVFLLTPGYLQAQHNYQLVKTSSSVKVSGTSSMHDWEMSMENFSCNVEMGIGNTSIGIGDVVFLGKAKSIKSTSSIMNSKTYEALKADKYSEIVFRGSAEKEIQLTTGTFKGTLTGNLKLAGRSKEVKVNFSGIIQPDGKIHILGTEKIAMSDYDIEPPTAMFGTLKTGDIVTVVFDLVFVKE
jgi:polyisoprenoid-binding protein YceI